MRALILGALLIPTTAQAGDVEYDGVSWVELAPRYDRPTAPLQGWLRHVARDDRQGPERWDRALVGQDSGVGFSIMSVVSSDLSAVKVRDTTAVDLAAGAIEAALGAEGVRTDSDLGAEAPRLETRLLRFWCDEPGDDDTDCWLEAELALTAPGQDAPGWREIVSVRHQPTVEGEREDSFLALLSAFSAAVTDALQRGAVAQLARVHRGDVERTMAAQRTPELSELPPSWLLVTTLGGERLDPAGRGRVPSFEDRPRVRIVEARDLDLALPAADVIERLEGSALSELTIEGLARLRSDLQAGQQRLRGSVVMAGISGACLLVGGVLAGTLQQRAAAGESRFSLVGPLAGSLALGISGGVVLGISAPLGIGGGAKWHRSVGRIEDLEGGELTRLDAAPLIIETVRAHNRALPR